MFLTRITTPRFKVELCGTRNDVTRNSSQCTTHKTSFSRRNTLWTILSPVLTATTGSAFAFEVPEVTLRPELAPDASKYDPTDSRLRAAAARIQDALKATDVTEEEQIWTEIIEQYSTLDANWVPDVVGRAWGNRGNARSRQGKMEAAINDLNKAIELCPWSVDPVLNRGVVLESLGRFDEAIRDYRMLLSSAPYDPAIWNNLGNAYAGKGEWSISAKYYGRAASLAPEFAFASANEALALYQTGDEEEALRLIRSLLRKYPSFTDMRAALVASLWGSGKEGEAESEWGKVQDPRYSDPVWLRESRRWPPRLTDALIAFLNLRSL
eukprot:g4638.t1